MKYRDFKSFSSKMYLIISYAISFFPLASPAPAESPESLGYKSKSVLKRIVHYNVLNPISVLGCNPYANGVS